MLSPADQVFGSTAVKHRILTPEQVALGAKIQNVLAGLGISKSLAVISVEAGWMELDHALGVVTSLRKHGTDHPEVKPRAASEADEAVLDRLTPAARKRLESASRALAALFYARGAGTLALDQGSPAAAARNVPRKSADPTPAPARRLKPPVIEPIAPPPPRKSGALGAVVAVVAALAAIIGLMATRKKPPAEEPEPTPVAVAPPATPPRVPTGPPKPPPPPPPVEVEPVAEPADPAADAGVEAQRKRFIEEQEREAANLLEEVKSLLAEGRPASARGRLKRLTVNYGWTEFFKLRREEIARLTRDAESEASFPVDDPGYSDAETGEVLPAMAAALKRLDDGAASDARRAASAKTRLSGAKSDLALRGGQVVKGAEVLDVSREDVRVRGEMDGTKVDLLLSWSALEAESFVALQKAIARGQNAAGHFEVGRAAIRRRLWKEAKAAFDECARADPAWKPRLPDLGAILADPALLKGSARRLGDGRLRVEYAFDDPEQAADFAPMQGSSGAVSLSGGELKLEGKSGSFWTLKDLAFTGDVDIHVEADGEVGFGFDGPPSVRFTGTAVRGTPISIRKRGPFGEGPRKLIVGVRGDATIVRLWIAGAADAAEMKRRLGPLERLEGCAHAGDFRLDPPAADAEAVSRAALAEAALDAGLIEEAWSLAEEAVAKAPAGGLAIAVRGLIRLAQGETRLAIADADLALALDPCRGEVAMRARRILGAIRGSAAAGAFRRVEAGPWVVRTDLPEDRLTQFAAKLVEAGQRFADAVKDAGAAPAGIPATIFASHAAWSVHLESAEPGEAAVVDGPGVEAELIRRAAGAYLRRAVAAAPAWFHAGMTAHLTGEVQPAEMAQAPPLDALIRKPSADFTESDRLQSASFVRYLLAAAKEFLPDLLNKLRHGVPAIEVFSGRDVKKLDADWRAWAEREK